MIVKKNFSIFHDCFLLLITFVHFEFVYNCMQLYELCQYLFRFNVLNRESQLHQNNFAKKRGRNFTPKFLSLFHFQFYFITRTFSTPSIVSSFFSTASGTSASTSIIVYAYSFRLLFVIREMFIFSCANTAVS